MYRVINKELNLASCNLADLTVQQITSFIEDLEDVATLRNMVVFYDAGERTITLNADHPLYADYLQITTRYLQSSEEERIDLIGIAEGKARNFLLLLRKYSLRLERDRDLDTVSTKMPMAAKHWIALQEIYSRHLSTCLKIEMAFKYGFMWGKREERAKRKANANAQIKANE